MDKSAYVSTCCSYNLIYNHAYGCCGQRHFHSFLCVFLHFFSLLTIMVEERDLVSFDTKSPFHTKWVLDCTVRTCKRYSGCPPHLQMNGYHYSLKTIPNLPFIFVMLGWLVSAFTLKLVCSRIPLVWNFSGPRSYEDNTHILAIYASSLGSYMFSSLQIYGFSQFTLMIFCL